MEKKKMSEEYEKKVLANLEKIVEQTKPKEESSKTVPQVPQEKGHKNLVEQMLCKDCNPPEEYKKAHLELMGQKECKDCGNVDKKGEEYCSDCGEEYRASET